MPPRHSIILTGSDTTDTTGWPFQLPYEAAFLRSSVFSQRKRHKNRTFVALVEEAHDLMLYLNGHRFLQGRDTRRGFQ